MITDINSEDRLVQQTFADHLRDRLGWESVYAYNSETFGSPGTLGRASERDVVLARDLRAALERLNADLPESHENRPSRSSRAATSHAHCCNTTESSMTSSAAACRSSGATHPARHATQGRR